MNFEPAFKGIFCHATIKPLKLEIGSNGLIYITVLRMTPHIYSQSFKTQFLLLKKYKPYKHRTMVLLSVSYEQFFGCPVKSGFAGLQGFIVARQYY